MQPILGMRKNLLHRFRQRNSAVHAHVFVPVKKWEKYSDADRNRILQRLNRFADAYRTQYRENGLLHLPLRYEIRNGTQICVEKCDLSGNIIPTASVHHMALFQVDILFRSLLMQLRQLESIRFIHGAISPETVVICQTPKVYSAAVTDITAGRFADEPVLSENLVRGSCMSPETCRAVKYPYADQEGQATDIFSAGCLYYQYLTGAVLDVGDSPVSPAEAIWLGIPVSVEGIYGFLASLIRWMLWHSSAE